jgi:enoyl-CoA hydratase/carnithine racemase
MPELVLRADEGGIAFLTLNRPDALNALSPAVFVELRAHIDAIAAALDTVGCVVLRGAGRSFCAGNDLKAIMAGEQAPRPHYQADTLQAIEDLPQPVIASVHGHCYTGGLELALACDLLIAAESARFADTHGRWGMTPTWGMSQRLPRRIGPLRAKELMLSGRTADGKEAAAIGIANRCVPDAQLESTTLELAKQIVANSWHTLRADKKLVNQGQDFGLEQALAYERRESPGASPDAAQRVAGFGKKS